MNTTHSPAPFAAGKEYGNRQNEIEDADGCCVAVVWVRRARDGATAREQFKDDQQGMANWRLMIAAPELLAVLKTIVARARLVPCKYGGEYATQADVAAGEAMESGKWLAESSVDGWIVAARNAIAKAQQTDTQQ